jgi:hemoglobin-like flavoprotein
LVQAEMGISSSVASRHVPSSSSSSHLNEIVLFLMPMYYISSSITNRDLHLSQLSWNQILSNKSSEFIKKCQINSEFDEKYHQNCCQWFTDLFYERLFDIHPLAKVLFIHTSMEKLKRHLIKVISLTLTQNKNPFKFQKLMKNLTILHCHRGVRAIEYGIMGNVLFHTLQQCLGVNEYSSILDKAWKAIYSSMLKEIIPECVKYELQQQQPWNQQNATSSLRKFVAEDTRSTRYRIPFDPTPAEDEII